MNVSTYYRAPNVHVCNNATISLRTHSVTDNEEHAEEEDQEHQEEEHRNLSMEVKKKGASNTPSTSFDDHLF